MFNRHKFARKLGRLKRQKDVSPYAPRRLDFSWDRHRAGNPFFRKAAGVSRRMLLLLVLVLCTVAASAAIVLFHPFFSIERDEITVEGLRRISKEELTDAVAGILSVRQAFVFPGNAYVLLEEGEIADILSERYPLASVSVEKRFPNELRIHVEETHSTLLYDTGSRLALVGPEGRVIELLRPMSSATWTVPTSSSAGSSTTAYVPPTKKFREAFGSYPIVFDARNKDIAMNSAAIEAETAKGALEWFTLARMQNLEFSYAAIVDDLGEATIETEEGWEIRVSVRENIPDQMEKLRILLANMTGEERAALVYVDLRFRDRIFWQ